MRLLKDVSESIGPACFAGVDDPFVNSLAFFRRKNVASLAVFPFVAGEQVRHWIVEPEEHAFAPYDSSYEPYSYEPDKSWGRYLWQFRSTLESVIGFGQKTRKEAGESWWTWYRWIPERVRASRKIVFASVATHNQFSLVDQRYRFNRHAPLVMLATTATEDDHLSLLGLLNSSTACFWMKQIFHNKGSSVDQAGARHAPPHSRISGNTTARN